MLYNITLSNLNRKLCVFTNLFFTLFIFYTGFTNDDASPKWGFVRFSSILGSFVPPEIVTHTHRPTSFQWVAKPPCVLWFSIHLWFWNNLGSKLSLQFLGQTYQQRPGVGNACSFCVRSSVTPFGYSLLFLCAMRNAVNYVKLCSKSLAKIVFSLQSIKSRLLNEHIPYG